MNNREWIRQTVKHHDTGKTPFNFDFCPPVRKRIEEYYGTADIEEELNFPLRMTGLKTVKPLYASPNIYGSEVKDEFGVVWSTSHINRGSPVKHCLEQPILSEYSFPDPKAEYRFEEIGAWCKKQEGNFTLIWVGDLWERASFMRGMEELLLDTKLNPGFVESLLRGICDGIIQTMAILFGRFEFDAVALSDDYGNQRQLVISPSDWRLFIKPLLKEIYDLTHKNRRIVFHHSCGNVREIIPDLIEMGLDILHPIQPEAMDIYELKNEFGQDLTFCGGVRTQDFLVRAKLEEIRKEIGILKEKMGKGGGYILEPGITIQADVPVENIVAVIEEARND